MIIVTTIMAGILLLMGVIAMNKSMTLKLKFDVNPNILCYIEYKLTSESDYKPLFCNVTNTGAELTPTVNDLATLSGNTLTLTQAFANMGPTMGASFDFKIYNYNSFKLKVTCGDASPKNTTANEGLENQPTTADPIIFTSITTGGADIVFVFEEFSGFTVTFDFNNETGTTKTYEGAEFASTLTSEYIPQRNGYTFAGYYSGDVISPENLPNEENNTQYYNYSYLTNATTIQLNANAPALSGSITLHARWLPFTINSYPDDHEVWAGYKYIEFENHETQEKNYYISEPYDMPARWIIIGANDTTNLGSEVVQNTSELSSNEVLLMSEYILFRSSFGIGTWKDSNLQSLLNSTFIGQSGLYTNYIPTKSMKTNNRYYWSSGNRITPYETEDKIFLLAYSWTGDDQTFLVETYLGDTYTDMHYTNFNGVFGYQWDENGWFLRSCQGEYGDSLVYHPVYVRSEGVVAGVDPWIFESSGNYDCGVRPCFVLNLA